MPQQAIQPPANQAKQAPLPQSVEWADDCLAHARGYLISARFAAKKAGETQKARILNAAALVLVRTRHQLTSNRRFVWEQSDTPWQVYLLLAHYWAGLAKMHLNAARANSSIMPSLRAKVAAALAALRYINLDKHVRVWVKPFHRSQFMKRLITDVNRTCSDLIREARADRIHLMRKYQAAIYGE
jgi:hypothetical protein